MRRFLGVEQKKKYRTLFDDYLFLEGFKIFQGYDHYNNKPLYQLQGIKNDYVGMWHETKEEVMKEFHDNKLINK